MSDFEKREDTKNTVKLAAEMASLIKTVSEDLYPVAILDMKRNRISESDLPTLDGFTCSFSAGVIQTLRAVLLGPERSHPLLTALASIYLVLQDEVDSLEQKYGDYQEHFDDIFKELEEEYRVGENNEDAE